MQSRSRLAFSLAAVAGTAVALDLLWVGVAAKPLYDSIGDLKRSQPLIPAVGLFYAMYATATFLHAVRPSTSTSNACRRGASLGFVAYATYELTNWALLKGWPAALVPVDTIWGAFLTAASAAAGRAVLGRDSVVMRRGRLHDVVGQ